ncbi:BBP [Candida pseudojiufengensis]|uniref:BBP n=1 Tax=Candida pseudojiufengensis TaxID=497109 RepID=UPI002224DD31|nr:BBP [Candida pseudojiufengensis]KAI5966192.1 BBP [Candida pseudojiufengensis]
MSRGRSEAVRETRWSGTPARTKQFGHLKLETVITGHLTQEQLDAYQHLFRIEEISYYLRTAQQEHKSIIDLLPSSTVDSREVRYKRDPSPPPKYDNHGNRINTREQRITEELEKERHGLVETAAGSIKDYIAPSEYRKPAKTLEKLYIPVKDYPEINFVGFLIGPRGRTLKRLQDESGARLQIRGKGSVKEGKSTSAIEDKPGNTTESVEDDLHVLITSDSQQKIAKAVKMCNEIIEKLVFSPVGQNELKREQLKELAVLNGTLRETKPFDPEAYQKKQQRSLDITKIVCKICGKVGHYARDCKQNIGQNINDNRGATDSYTPGSSSNSGDSQPWKKPRLEVPTPPWQAASSSKPPPPSMTNNFPPPPPQVSQTHPPPPPSQLPHTHAPPPPPSSSNFQRNSPAPSSIQKPNSPVPPPPQNSKPPPPPTQESKPQPPPTSGKRWQRPPAPPSK